jgi:hypothetical protein
MEVQMTKTLIVLLLLSVGLTACVVEPGGSGYREHGWNDAAYGQYHAGQVDHGNWNH